MKNKGSPLTMWVSTLDWAGVEGIGYSTTATNAASSGRELVVLNEGDNNSLA